MKQPSSEILLDSIHPQSNSRLTTFLIEVPKFLIGEIVRHRALSFSVASSRAIKTDSLLGNLDYTPVFWGENCPGMIPHKELTPQKTEQALELWRNLKQDLIENTYYLNALNIHKGTVNRLIENFSYVKCVMTGTEFHNFFSLRAEYNADPHLGFLATKMLKQYLSNVPTKLKINEYHIPFILDTEKELPINEKLVKAVARCARTSYNNFYGKNDYESDLKLFNLLKDNQHNSPFEHSAKAVANSVISSNFHNSWLQYRKEIERPSEVDLEERLIMMEDLCKQRGFSL